MITETQESILATLRERIQNYMSEKRTAHTYAVEREITRLSGIYAPEEEFTLRVSALLHDITKELSLQKQLQLCLLSDIIYTREEMLTPKIFHSRTAEAVIKQDFPEWATEDILSAIRWHTTGHADMTLFEQLLFLADFIEDIRTFDSCVKLRRFFYDGIADGADKISHLRDTMILAFDFTIDELVSDGKPIHVDTVSARNYFIYEKVRCSK